MLVERLLNTLWTSAMEMWADSGGHIPPYNRVWIEIVDSFNSSQSAKH